MRLIDKLLRDTSFQDTLDLASLIEQKSPARFGKASGNGTKRTVKGACPWCGGTDRFAVFVGETPQRYYCGIHGHGCGKRGDAIQFLRDYEDRSFDEACAYLSGDASLKVSSQVRTKVEQHYTDEKWQRDTASFCTLAERRLWDDPEQIALTYLHGRGFTDITIRRAHLGYAVLQWEKQDTPCLVIPWFVDKRSIYNCVTYRDLRPGVDPKKRYKNRPGSNDEYLYLVDSLSLKRDAVFLVEGEIDALSITQEAGDLVAVVATGGTNGSQSMRSLLRLLQANHVFVAFDAEEKGETSAAFWLKTLSNATRWAPALGKDANDMLRDGLSVRTWVASALAWLATPAEIRPEPFTSYDQFLSTVDQIGADVFGEGCTITLLPKGYTHDRRIADLRDSGAFSDEAERENERAMWRRIREARAKGSIPRWLVPGTEDWNTQVERSGKEEMHKRRSAWEDQQKTAFQ